MHRKSSAPNEPNATSAATSNVLKRLGVNPAAFLDAEDRRDEESMRLMAHDLHRSSRRFGNTHTESGHRSGSATVTATPVLGRMPAFAGRIVCCILET